METIKKLMKIFEVNSQNKLADKLGCTQGVIASWINQDYISLKWAMRIEFLSEGSVKARELNPEEFKWIESKKKVKKKS